MEMLIKLLANFSAETLQVRKEWYDIWYDIFKMMRVESLQSRIIDPVSSHSDSMDKFKNLRLTKAKRIQQFQASFTTNTNDPHN